MSRDYTGGQVAFGDLCLWMYSPVLFSRIQYMDKRNNNNNNKKKQSGTSTRRAPAQKAAQIRRRPLAPNPAQDAFAPRRQAEAAVSYATGQSTMAPRIDASRDSARIVHRELVGGISGSTLFATPLSLALNPGLPTTFPWLSSQAQGWEQYRFNKLQACYYTRCSSATPGSLMLIPDYDAADSAPVSELIASAYEDVTEDCPWKDQCCKLRVAAMFPMGPKKFIRTTALSANQDIKTYDAGNLFVGTIDGTAIPWGKLWIEYDVTLYSPQLNPAGVGIVAAYHATGVTPTSVLMLGASPQISANSTLFVTLAVETLTFNTPGRFSIYLRQTGTSVTFGTLSVGNGGTFVTTFDALSLADDVGTGGVTMAQWCVVDTIVGSTVLFDNTIVNGTSAELLISRLPANLA